MTETKGKSPGESMVETQYMVMPDQANRKLFNTLQSLGVGLAQTGQLDSDLLPRMAGIERYPAILSPLFKLFVRTPLASWYWDSQLKENGVYDQRFARPYAEDGA